MNRFKDCNIDFIKNYLIVPGLLIFATTVSVFGTEKIEISSFEYPPFMSSAAIPGKGDSFGVDVTKAAFRQVDIEPVFKFYPMKRCILMFENGESYANLGTIDHFKNFQQKDKIIWVKIIPVRFIFYYFKQSHGQITFNHLSELKGFTIGNVRGSSTTQILTAAGLKIGLAPSIELNFKKFIGKRFDLCVSAELTGDEFLRNNYPEKQREIAKIDPPIMTIQMSMNFAGSHSALAEKFQRGMDIIRADGTFQKISKKYFGR